MTLEEGQITVILRLHPHKNGDVLPEYNLYEREGAGCGDRGPVELIRS